MRGIEGSRAEHAPQENPRLRKEDSGQEALWSRFAELATRERNPDFSDGEFEELIDCEQKAFLQDNPPLQDIFDPEQELQRLRQLPRREQDAALELFKDKLVRQRHAYMECRMLIERRILRDADVPIEALSNIQSFFGTTYGFPLRARRDISNLIHAYRENHERVQTLRRNFPDDRALIEELTGISIDTSNTSIIEGPASIDIITGRNNLKRLYTRNGRNAEWTDPGGFKDESVEHKILFTVTRNDLPNISNIQTHEREHVKNAIFGEAFDLYDPLLLRKTAQEVQTETNPRVREMILETQLCIFRDSALDRAKDEIIAMLKDGVSNYFDRLLVKDGNPYDYLFKERAAYSTSPLYAKAVQKVLVEEYDRIIVDGIEAFKAFRKVHEYSNDAMIALLTDVPLERWPNTLRRVNEHEKRFES